MTRPWDYLFSEYTTNPRLVGDFNTMACSQEKVEGNDFDINAANKFLDYIVNVGLIDLGYTGTRFT